MKFSVVILRNLKIAFCTIKGVFTACHSILDVSNSIVDGIELCLKRYHFELLIYLRDPLATSGICFHRRAVQASFRCSGLEEI